MTELRTKISELRRVGSSDLGEADVLPVARPGRGDTVGTTLADLAIAAVGRSREGLDRALRRMFRLADDDDDDDLPPLPGPAGRANRVPGFDALGRFAMIPAVAGGLAPDAANIAFQLDAESVVRTLADKGRERVSVLDAIPAQHHAAIRARTSTYDAGPAIQRLLDSGARWIYVPAGLYWTSITLVVPDGVTLIGEGSGEYNVIYGGVAIDQPISATVIAKTNGDINGDAVIRTGRACGVVNLRVVPHNAAAVIYYFAEYPKNTGNTSYGVKLGPASYAEGVTADAFAKAGLVLGVTAKLHRCHAFRCNVGITSAVEGGSDCMLTQCVVMFCHDAGMLLKSNFWQISCCRIEWNGSWGIWAQSGENIFLGNVFDRNARAGLYLDGGWGNVVGVNYWNRNGAGGDGSYGRWGFSVPGHPSYVEIANEDSCHIKLRYQRDVALGISRYHAAADDAGAGSFSPGHIYCFDDVPGANGNITIIGNAGEYAAAGGSGGYNPNYPGGAGIFSGDDTANYRITYWQDLEVSALVTRRHETPVAPQAQAASYNVNVGARSGGKATFKFAAGGGPGFAEVTFADTGAHTPVTHINNIIGTFVAAATFVRGGGGNILTVTFSGMSYYDVRLELMG